MKKKSPKIEISIGVLCFPRNDRLTAAIARHMASAAATFLKPSDHDRLLGDIEAWIVENNLDPKPRRGRPSGKVTKARTTNT